MRAQTEYRPTIITLSLLVILLTAGLSAFFFTRLDQIVHGDLYRYGLQYSYEWAGRYWNYSRLILGLLALAILMISASIILTLPQVQTLKIPPTKPVTGILLIVGIATFIASMYFLTRLDQIVQGDLYRYGLQYSYEWAGRYWNYSRLILELLALAIGISCASVLLISVSAPSPEAQLLPSLHLRPRRINLTKLTYYAFISVGVVALAFSINYNSTILAFIGLGLLFWGAILFYIRPENYVKKALLDKTTLPSLTNLNQIIERGFKGKAIYLPSKYFKTLESSKVYISAEEDIKLPSPEQTQNAEDEIIIEEPYGVLITPLGIELKRLFEKTLGTSFTRVNLQYLEQNIAKLLVEELEIAQEAELETKSDRVLLKLKNSIYQGICKETKNLTKIHCSLGCPLCSAIACALAEATGKSVAIEKDQTNDDDQTTTIEYRLLEPEAEQTQE